MRLALAPIAIFLLTSACSAPSEQGQPQAARPSAVAQRVGNDCLSRGDGAEARRAALAEATATEQLKQAERIAGAQTAWVVDRAEVLSAAAEQRLSARARSLETATSDQVVVVTVPELGGASVEQFSLALGNRWGIGRAELDNGVLLLVAPRERRVRVAVGCGIEDVLTDARAAEIVERILPALAAGQFDRAVSVAFDEIEATLRARPERQRAS